MPVENVLGHEGQGYIKALKILANGRAGLAARNLGSCQKLLDLSATYASQRIQFNVPILAHQVVAHMLAEMAMEISSSFLYLPCSLDGDECMKVIKEAAILKMYGSEVYNKGC